MRKDDDGLLASVLFIVRSFALLCVVMVVLITLVDWLSGNDSPVVRAISAASFELRR